MIHSLSVDFELLVHFPFYLHSILRGNLQLPVGDRVEHPIRRRRDQIIYANKHTLFLGHVIPRVVKKRIRKKYMNKNSLEK